MITNLVQYEGQAYTRKAMFIYKGTSELKKGYGMCFDMDYANTGTGQLATDPYGSRGMKVVQVPVAANSQAFAGVLTQDYPADAAGKTKMIELALPGGCAMVAIGGTSTVVNSTRLTCSIGPDAGIFTLGGASGKGSVTALQTDTIANETALTFASLDGSAVNAGTTITETGIGTACGFGGDTDATAYYVTILGGGDDDAVATQSRQQVLTAPSADTITVGTTPGTTCYLTLYVTTERPPLVLARLDEDGESGMVEFVSPSDNAAAQHLLPGGTTFVCGGYTMTTGDSTSTLADGLFGGMTKAFAGLGALTTKDYLVTVTSGITMAGGALASLAIDAAGEEAFLEWHGSYGGNATGAWRSIVATATEA